MPNRKRVIPVMNTYRKYIPIVYLAECTEQHEKGEIITMSTKYGQEHEAEVHNLIFEKNGMFYYSVTRADGTNTQTWAQRRAEKQQGYAGNAEKRADQYFTASKKDSAFLSLGEPIKVGHHSERRHRKVIEQAWNNTGKMVGEMEKAAEYQSRAAYWESRAKDINLSMPDSLEYYQHKLEEATRYHARMKAGEIPQEHSYSLTYARKAVKELEEKVKYAEKLWK